MPADPAGELSLRTATTTDGPLADLDLDRLIGAAEPSQETAVASVAAAGVRRASPLDSDPDTSAALPLFTRERSGQDDMPLITAPRPARPPLAVRRATPEVARRRTPRLPRRDEGPELALEPPVSGAAEAGQPAMPVGPATELSPASVSIQENAPRVRRVVAALIDVAFLGAINGAVLYLTLALVGLSMADVFTLPLVPMGAFLLLLNGGYLVAFTAAHGQTIGKMLLSVRVIADNADRVDVAGAFLRAAAVLLTVVTFGVAYLPVLLSRDGRALHDRLSRTRVVRHA